MIFSGKLPGGAHDVEVAAGLLYGLLARELAAPVLVDRLCRVVFVVGRALLAVEYFVRADVGDGNAGGGAGPGNVAAALTVDGERCRRVALGGSGVGPGRGVDHDLRAERLDRLTYGGGRSDVECSVAGRANLVLGERALERGSQPSTDGTGRGAT